MRNDVYAQELTSMAILRALVLVVLAYVPAAQPVVAQSELRYRFEPGKTLRYQFQQKNDIKTKSMGQEGTNTTTLTIDMTWKVQKVAQDGSADILMKVDRVRTNTTVDAPNVPPELGKTQYDTKEEKASQQPAAQLLESVYRPAVSADYMLKVTSRGQITEAKVPQSVTTAVEKSPFKAVADGGSILTEKGLTSLFVQLLPPLPEKPVAKGGSWTSKLDLLIPPLSLAVTGTYKLAEASNMTAKVTAQLDTKIDAQPGTPLTVETKKQTGTGTYVYDVKGGRLTESKIQQSFELAIGVMNQQIEQTISIDESLKLLP